MDVNSKLFIMSVRYNKSTPEDFGLVPSSEPDVFIMPSDHSQWRKRNLYDFGVGKENGYCRLPLPGFDDLANIILHSELKDNKYGAAAIILDDYIDELLDKCQEIFRENVNVKRFSTFFNILQLDDPINRSSILGKSYNEIYKDYQKWEEISRQVKLLKHSCPSFGFRSLLSAIFKKQL